MSKDRGFYSDRLVTFEKPIPRSKIWVCIVGGWEFSGENKLELMEKAIQMLKCELSRLEIEYEIENDLRIK